MQRFKQFNESTKIKWKKVPDGYGAGNKKVFKHVSPDGKFEIRLSGMDSMKKNRDGSQKVMPTLFDNTKAGGDIPRHPVTAYRNVDQAKKEAQRWFDTHWNK
jgi:hypothetical protein